MPSAAILQFRRPEKSPLTANIAMGPAQIIIFPGVQYIRVHDDGDTFSVAITPPRTSSPSRPSARPRGH